MANQYTSRKVPWNQQYNAGQHQFKVVRTPDGKTFAVIFGENIIKPIKVFVEKPADPRDWRQKIQDAFDKATEILREQEEEKSWVDYKTEEVLKRKPFWSIFGQPVNKFWQLVRKIK